MKIYIKLLSYLFLILLFSFESLGEENNPKVRDDNAEIQGDKCIPSKQRKEIYNRIDANIKLIEARKNAGDCKSVTKFCLCKAESNSYFYCGNVEVPLVETDECLRSYQALYPCYKKVNDQILFFNTLKECENYNKLTPKI